MSSSIDLEFPCHRQVPENEIHHSDRQRIDLCVCVCVVVVVGGGGGRGDVIEFYAKGIVHLVFFKSHPISPPPPPAHACCCIAEPPNRRCVWCFFLGGCRSRGGGEQAATELLRHYILIWRTLNTVNRLGVGGGGVKDILRNFALCSKDHLFLNK